MQHTKLTVYITLLVASGLLIYTVSTASNSNTKRVSVVLPTTANPYWQDMAAGITNTSQNMPEWTAHIQAGEENTDADAQIRILRSELRSNPPDALILGPASATALVPTVREYNEADIPVIVVDSALEKDALRRHDAHYEAFISSNNKEGASKAAQRIEHYIGKTATVGIIGGSTGHETAIARRSGFLQTAPQTWNTTVQNADWDRKEANRVMRSYMQDMPDAVFAANDQMALGAVDALTDSVPRQQWPVIVGFDATDDGVKAVEQGKICATIAQHPRRMGRRAVRFAEQLSTGEASTGNNVTIGTDLVPAEPRPCR